MAVTVFNSWGGYSTGLTGYAVISELGGINAVGGLTAPNVVYSFNGSTGNIQGVSAAVAGTGISVSGATGAVTITNIGVQSIGGATGAVTYLDCGSL